MRATGLVRDRSDSLTLDDAVEDKRTGLTYLNNYLSAQLADQLLNHCLRELPWQEEIVRLFGKTHVAPRRSCAIGDENCVYRYQGSQTEPIPFTYELDQLRHRLAADLTVPFNFILATLYRDGSDYVGWHADDERDLVGDQLIVNVSLGSVRRFHVKTRDGRYRRAIDTEHGSLVLLSGPMQKRTKHRLAKTAQSVNPRVVLSFRQVKQ